MKKMIYTLLAVWGMVLASEAISFADGDNKPGVRKKQHRQRERIREGIRSGSLTKDEAKMLKEKQRQLQDDKKAAKADGVVTPEERAQLKDEKEALSQAIHDEKHDSETQPPTMKSTPSGRIREGIRSGSLTEDEAKMLKEKQHQLRDDKKAAKADGVVTPEERAQLKAEKEAISQAIHDEKHDSETQPPPTESTSE